MNVTIDIDEETYKLFETQAGLIGLPLEEYITFLLKQQLPQSATRKKERDLGWAKGMIWMSDDFDEPLEEFKDYM